MDFLLVRRTTNRLNDRIAKNHLKEIAETVSRPGVGIFAKTGTLPNPASQIDAESGGEYYVYKVPLRFQDNSNLQDSTAIFTKLTDELNKKAAQHGWKVEEAENAEIGNGMMNGRNGKYQPPAVQRTPFIPPLLSQNVYGEFFKGIFEREPPALFMMQPPIMLSPKENSEATAFSMGPLRPARQPF